MRWVAASLVVAVLLAGCTSDGDPKVTTTTDDCIDCDGPEMGTIEGVVTDENELPLSGVQVGVRTTDLLGATNADGVFAFTLVSPGEYVVDFNRIGFEPTSRKVTVVAAEVATMDVQLAPATVIVPYPESQTFQGHIEAGQTFVDIITGSLGLPGCDACQWQLNASESVTAMLLEFDVPGSISNPNGNEIGFQLWETAKLNSGDTSQTPMATGYAKTGARVNVTTEFTARPGLTLVTYCDLDWVCVDESFTVYVSFFHHGYDGRDYTARPPSE